MKCLTIKPVWAHAIIHLGRPVECRSWQTHYRGPLAIHASAALGPRANEDADWITRVTGLEVPDVLDVGAVIGVVDLVSCMLQTDYGLYHCLNPAQDAASPWVREVLQSSADVWIWELRNPRPCEPVDCKGKLGFWEFGGAIVPLGKVGP